ncbi:hypothetical protein CsSME_00038357 [Camellia sinensis var. sinensis]
MLPGLTKSYPITPSRLHLTYKDVWLRSSDGVRLHAWFIKLFPDCRGVPVSYFFEFLSYHDIRIILYRHPVFVSMLHRVHQKACKREGARVRDNGQKLHLCHHHHHSTPPLHKRASNRYWYIDQNTLQSCEESAIRFWPPYSSGLCQLPAFWQVCKTTERVYSTLKRFFLCSSGHALERHFLSSSGRHLTVKFLRMYILHSSVTSCAQGMLPFSMCLDARASLPVLEW